MSEQELKLLFHTLGYNFYPDWDTEEGDDFNSLTKKSATRAMAVLSILRIQQLELNFYPHDDKDTPVMCRRRIVGKLHGLRRKG